MMNSVEWTNKTLVLKKVVSIVLATHISIFAVNIGQAASFDCADAGTKVEKMICADAVLSKLDEELSKAYSEALTKVEDPGFLKQKQRKWIKERNRCKDITCLGEQYKRRMETLKKVAQVFATIESPDISEFDVDCDKPKSEIETLVCKEALDEHHAMLVELQWTLMRSKNSKNRQEVYESQRLWQDAARDVCHDGYCLRRTAYGARTKELRDMQARTGECYIPRPVLGNNYKVKPIEPVCQILEENLNRYCNDPPMVCELKVAPEYREEISFPHWKMLDPQTNRDLIMEFVLTPRQVGRDREDKLLKKVLQEDKSKIDVALVANSITFSESLLDLYNLGNPQTAYRLDYGTCRSDNPQLNHRQSWNEASISSPVEIQLSPIVIRTLFTEYFPLGRGSLHEVFMYAGQTYSYVMSGNSEPATGVTKNWLYVSRHSKWVNPEVIPARLRQENVCRFDYFHGGRIQ